MAANGSRRSPERWIARSSGVLGTRCGFVRMVPSSESKVSALNIKQSRRVVLITAGVAVAGIALVVGRLSRLEGADFPATSPTSAVVDGPLARRTMIPPTPTGTRPVPIPQVAGLSAPPVTHGSYPVGISAPPVAPDSYPPGISAVPLARPGVAVPAGAKVTAEDVTAFATAHGPMGKIGSRGTHVVERVELRLGRDVDARLKSRIGGHEDALLYIVTFRGDFRVAGPPGSSGSASSFANSVYDAKTGNLLMVGLGAR